MDGGESADAGDSPGDVEELGNGWARMTPLIRGSRQEIGVALLGDEIFVVGGYSRVDGNIAQVPWVDAYHPATNTWRSVADLPDTLHHVNVAVVNDFLYVVGSLRGNAFNADGRVFAYDPICDEWTEKSAMPAGSARGSSAVAVHLDRIYVFGGYRSGAVADASFYDPVSDSWTPQPDLPAARDHIVAGTIGDAIILAGGRSGGIFGHTDAVFAFDPDTETYAPKAPLPTSRAGAAATVLYDRLFVFGGEGDQQDVNGVFDEVEAYDPATDTWETHPPLPTKRHGMGAAAVGDSIYIPGGADIAAFEPLDTVERYTPPSP
jgi:N-acetylneuraminic acid mutarotase